MLRIDRILDKPELFMQSQRQVVVRVLVARTNTNHRANDGSGHGANQQPGETGIFARRIEYRTFGPVADESAKQKPGTAAE